MHNLLYAPVCAHCKVHFYIVLAEMHLGSYSSSGAGYINSE